MEGEGGPPALGGEAGDVEAAVAEGVPVFPGEVRTGAVAFCFPDLERVDSFRVRGSAPGVPEGLPIAAWAGADAAPGEL